jgi:hypothetical protein
MRVLHPYGASSSTPHPLRMPSVSATAITVAAIFSICAMGCGPSVIVSPVRASSRDILSDEQATLTISEPPDALAARLTEVMLRRGYHIVEKQVTEDHIVLKYKGERTVVQTIAGSGVRGSMQVRGTSNNIGSVFYAFAAGKDASTTVLRMVGKPTGNGREVCSDRDQDLDPCGEDLKAGVNFVGRQQMTGREEAEAIRGVFAELNMRAGVDDRATTLVP